MAVAFVVVSHQPSGHVSLLPELLQKHTAMPVVEATDGMRVAPNYVYLSTPGRSLAMLNGVLHVMEPDADGRVALPIDYFFRSLAEDQGESAIGVVLSGTGTDGTLGLRAIKAHAGMTMAQEAQTAKYTGMPESAIRSGAVDYVRPAGSMVEQIRTFLTGVAGRDAQRLAGDSPALGRIFVELRDRTGHDFSVHKVSTSRRRIERRMNVHQIETHRGVRCAICRSILQEIDALFRELLIGVTSFFRAPAAFDALAEKVLPKLLDSRPDGTDVRVWVPGCSTGEEAYSLAILFREYLGAQKRSLRVQIFATDLDRTAIETARAGVYPHGIATDLTPERLRRWFVQEDSHYRVTKDLRDLVIFAPHDLLRDPPFTKLDLISCRNLLIYLESRSQRHLIPVFHYALKPDGLLVPRRRRVHRPTRGPVLDGRSKVEDLPAGERPAPGAGGVSDRSREDHAGGGAAGRPTRGPRDSRPRHPRRAHAADARWAVRRGRGQARRDPLRRRPRQ